MARPDICVIDSDTEGEVYFTVTQKYTISRQASVTDFRIEDGRKITDHHTPDNRRFVFSGIVSLEAALGDTEVLNPAQVELKLDNLIESGETFTFTSDSELSFRQTDKCVLINYSIDRNESMVGAVEVSVEIRQIQFTSAVTRTTATTASIEMRDTAAAKTDLGKKTVTKLTLEDTIEEKIKAEAKADKLAKEF